jgi:hypothetical protein
MQHAPAALARLDDLLACAAEALAESGAAQRDAGGVDGSDEVPLWDEAGMDVSDEGVGEILRKERATRADPASGQASLLLLLRRALPAARATPGGAVEESRRAGPAVWEALRRYGVSE